MALAKRRLHFATTTSKAGSRAKPPLNALKTHQVTSPIAGQFFGRRSWSIASGLRRYRTIRLSNHWVHNSCAAIT